jgi:hypothetical protein
VTRLWGVLTCDVEALRDLPLGAHRRMRAACACGSVVCAPCVLASLAMPSRTRICTLHVRDSVAALLVAWCEQRWALDAASSE